MNYPTTNKKPVRSSAIHRTFRHYRINKLIFINLAGAKCPINSKLYDK